MGELVRYVVFQREICPETGKEHWQGYAELFKPCRIKQAQTALGIPKAHMEKRMGTRDQAREYCMKEDSRLWGPYELGEWIAGGQGARNDVKTVADMVAGGATDREVAEYAPATFMRMSRGIRELRSALSEKRDWKPNVEIYWSPGSETGKSLLAHDQYPDAFTMTDEKGWWDGYDCHEDVIVDDFRPHMWSGSFMLKLIDRYPMRVPIKGSSANFVAKNIIFTSNEDPAGWYKDIWPHIKRRCAYIMKVE